MRSEVACIPCVLRQCQRVVKAAKKNRSVSLQGCVGRNRGLGAGRRALAVLKSSSLAQPPSSLTSRVLLEIYRYLKVPDPFLTEKRRETRLGRFFSKTVKASIRKSRDPVRTALHYAAAGNIIDVGTQEHFDLPAALQRAQAERFALDDYPLFRKYLKTARTIFYILDNAGEIYFDMLFLELLKNYTLTVAAKSSPILNDVTKAETEALGLKRIARVIGTGSGFLGVDFAHRSEEFKTAYLNSDMIIAKGHANFESLVDRHRPAFFLLKAKCPVVAKKLGVLVGDSVFYHYTPVTGH
jgi:uncharacterized protein with ATP-grasp and redox domains